MFTYTELSNRFDKKEIESVVLTNSKTFKENLKDIERISELKEDTKYAIIVVPIKEDIKND